MPLDRPLAPAPESSTSRPSDQQREDRNSAYSMIRAGRRRIAGLESCLELLLHSHLSLYQAHLEQLRYTSTMTSAVTFPRGQKEGWATVTEPASGVWLLEMHNFQNSPDNRLEPEFIRQALLPALDYVELAWHKAAKAGTHKGGSLVITGERKVGKFFSNGLNLDCLPAYPTFFGDYYYKLLSRVITFPLTTIAAINGHCFAGGLCLALACDWRICRAGSHSAYF
ncbi:hypothetical protein C6P46_004210 [Rhodotorula mucilaginosa]|uniref:Uncharacterized protein n=1 Tax=Rhodotorula mucilaginosa TaxID=5537 RepID=A0A9P6W2V2_RHOMI|nr:hypothetical protein C6P46_004210 [Rhodotorula mucilaginosa]